MSNLKQLKRKYNSKTSTSSVSLQPNVMELEGKVTPPPNESNIDVVHGNLEVSYYLRLLKTAFDNYMNDKSDKNLKVLQTLVKTADNYNLPPNAYHYINEINIAISKDKEPDKDIVTTKLEELSKILEVIQYLARLNDPSRSNDLRQVVQLYLTKINELEKMSEKFKDITTKLKDDLASFSESPSSVEYKPLKEKILGKTLYDLGNTLGYLRRLVSFSSNLYGKIADVVDMTELQRLEFDSQLVKEFNDLRKEVISSTKFTERYNTEFIKTQSVINDLKEADLSLRGRLGVTEYVGDIPTLIPFAKPIPSSNKVFISTVPEGMFKVALRNPEDQFRFVKHATKSMYLYSKDGYYITPSSIDYLLKETKKFSPNISEESLSELRQMFAQISVDQGRAIDTDSLTLLDFEEKIEKTKSIPFDYFYNNDPGLTRYARILPESPYSEYASNYSKQLESHSKTLNELMENQAKDSLRELELKTSNIDEVNSILTSEYPRWISSEVQSFSEPSKLSEISNFIRRKVEYFYEIPIIKNAIEIGKTVLENPVVKVGGKVLGFVGDAFLAYDAYNYIREARLKRVQENENLYKAGSISQDFLSKLQK